MKLAEYLEKNDITTTDFAERCELSQPYIWQIANGQRRPSPDVAERIELATGGQVTAMELLYPHRTPAEPAGVVG